MGEAKRKKNARINGAGLPIVDRDNREKLKAEYKPGVWVFGIGPHAGCSQVFYGDNGAFYPFDFLRDYNPDHYRQATPREIAEVKKRVEAGRVIN